MRRHAARVCGRVQEKPASSRGSALRDRFPNALAAFEAETRSDLRPGAVLALWLSSIAAFLAAAASFPLRRELCARLHVYRGSTSLHSLRWPLGAGRTDHRARSIPWNVNGDEAVMGVFSRAVLEGKWDDPFTVGAASHPSLWFFSPVACAESVRRRCRRPAHVERPDRDGDCPGPVPLRAALV